MKNKLAFRDWHKILTDVRHEQDRKVKILTAGEKPQIDKLIKLFGSGAEQVFIPLDQQVSKEILEDTDLVVIVASGSATFNESLRPVARESIQHGLDVIAFIDGSGLSQASSQAKMVEAELAFGLSPARVVCFSSQISEVDQQSLTGDIIGLLENKRIALAAKVRGLRGPVVKKIIDEVASQNGIIGVASFLPASDLPVLTANQIRMVLMIAAAHGASLSVKRAKELLFVVGGGFTFRAVARQLLGFVPIAGWAVKGMVAYTGTRALGSMAAKYFDSIIDKPEGGEMLKQSVFEVSVGQSEIDGQGKSS